MSNALQNSMTREQAEAVKERLTDLIAELKDLCTVVRGESALLGDEKGMWDAGVVESSCQTLYRAAVGPVERYLRRLDGLEPS
jgi:hypothetical protein